MDITGTLAKLLATENLTVVHKAGATTASFNVESRVLTLPIFQGMCSEVSTMMAAHEVGHALQTPTDWAEHVADGTPFDFVNVIEDVRIEKYIQAKFPGLKRDFSRGYNELNERDFFQLEGQDVNKLSLIDRINIHFKLGYRAVVDFSTEEMVWVRAIDECETFQQVCLVAKMLSDWLKEQKQDQQQDTNTDGETEEGEQGDSEESNSPEASDTEKEESEGFGTKGIKGEEEEEQEDITPDTEANTGNGGGIDEEVSSTQRAMNEAMENHSAKFKSGTVESVNCVSADLEIVELDDLRSSWVPSNDDFRNEFVTEAYRGFVSSVKKDVAHMAQRFEMKKSADAYARASINKTGVLNTGKLHQYKLTDDIFLRQSVTPDGKSHGLVMLLDWSGSMANICLETVKQILVLTQFCRKVSIDFDVYTFTTGPRTKRSEAIAAPANTVANQVVGLVKVLSSSTKSRQLETDMFRLFVHAFSTSRSYYSSSYGYYSSLDMGGTPLDNAIIIAPELINRFRQRTGAQRISFVTISDGQSSPLYWVNEKGRYTYTYNQDYTTLRFGSSSYLVESKWDQYDTVGIVDVVKRQCPGVSFSNIFLGSQSASSSYVRHSAGEFNASEFRKTGGTVCTPKEGWDMISCLNPNNFNSTQEEIKVDDGAKKGQIKSALKKYLKAQSSCKVVLNQLVDEFS
jgi:hypothetical protein